MKRWKLVQLFPAVLSLALIAAVTWADDPEPEVPIVPDLPGVGIFGNIQEGAASLNEPLVGSTVLDFNGESHPATTIAEPLAVADLPNNFGGYAVTTAHVLGLDDGTMRTADEEYWTPVGTGGNFVVTGTWFIIGGTHRYGAATGYFDLYGIASMDAASVSVMLMAEGRISY